MADEKDNEIKQTADAQNSTLADNGATTEGGTPAGNSDAAKGVAEGRAHRSTKGGKPRRSLWLRVLRGLGWVALSLAVALIIICSAVVWVLTPERLTPIIERVASKNLNADVKLGRAELTFWSSFPQVKIEIDDLEIVSRSLDALTAEERATLPADADSVMRVSHFGGGVNLLHAISGKFTIYDVDINRPRLNLIQVNDSVSNFDIFPKSAPDTTSSGVMPEITINRFVLTDAEPIRYRNLSDSIDVAATLRTISLDGEDVPQYQLTIDSHVATPLLADVAYENVNIGLDGKINWSAAKPSVFNIDDLRLKVNEDVDLTVSTTVDMTDALTISRLDIALRNLRPDRLVAHLPGELRNQLATLDTDMAVNVTARLTRPYVVADSMTMPWVDLAVNIPDCRFNFNTIDFRHLAADVRAEVNGDDLNQSTVTVEQLVIDGKALDVKINGTVRSLLDNPAANGHFYGAIDFGQLPAIVKRQLGGALSGRLDADTKFDFKMSDFTPRGFHNATLDGDVNLRDLRYVSADTLTKVYTRHAQLHFGTDESFSRDDLRVDSLLVVKLNVDTASVWDKGTELRLKAFRGGFGASNVTTSSDTTLINPFGGAMHIDDFFCHVENDSVRLRLRDIGGYASLRRYKGDARVPLLEMMLNVGRLRLAQPSYMASLTGATIDVTAHLKPRRKGVETREKRDAHAGRNTLRGMADEDSTAQSLQARMLRLAANQVEQVEVEMIDFNVDNSFKSLLRRWNIHGSLKAKRGSMRVPSMKRRNVVENVDLMFNTDSVALRNLDYRIGQSDLQVKGLVSNIKQALSSRRPGPVKIQFDIQSDTINVNEIVRSLASMSASPSDELDWIDSEIAEIEETEELPDSITGPLLVPVNIDATLDIRANKVVYSDLLLSNFEGRLMINRGMVNLNNLSAKTDVGNIKLSGLYTAPTANDINFGMAMDLSNFHIARLPQMIPAIDSILPMMHYLSGVVNAQVAVTTDITPDMYFDMPTLKAAMQFSGDSLVVFDNETFRTLSKWLMFKDKKRNMIDSINVELTVADGLLNLYPFVVNIDRYKLGIMGYNDLDFNLNYHISVLKSPIPFKFGINIKGQPEKMKIRFGGAKFKDKMVAQRDPIASNTRISLLSEMNGAFRRGLRAARLGPLRIKGAADSTYMNAAEEGFTAADSVIMIREGLIEVPDSVAADIFLRTNTPYPYKNDSVPR